MIEEKTANIKQVVKSVLIRGWSVCSFFLPRDRYLKNRITIVHYHEIGEELFTTHLKFFLKHYNPVSLKDVSNFILEKDLNHIPPKSLLITFDDGWQSNFQLLSVIKKFRIRPVIYLIAGLIGTNRKIWNYILERENSEKKINLWLKSLSDSEKNKWLKKHKGFYPEKEYPERSMLSKDEIKEMAPYVDFQSHGMFHPVMTKCSDEQLDFEFKESKRIISSITDQTCYAIAYPYGKYSPRVGELAKKAGYQIGRISNKPGLLKAGDDPMGLKALGIAEDMTCNDIKKSLSWCEINSVFGGMAE